MKHYFIIFFSTLMTILSSSCSSSAGSHSESTDISVTNGDNTEQCELLGVATVKSGEGYNCGTFFNEMIRDFRGTNMTGTPDFSLQIFANQSPSEIHEGDDLTSEKILYYNYMGDGRGTAYQKNGSVTVMKKSSDNITLKFDNFQFQVSPTSEEFTLHGEITFKFAK